jgi:hypothetical protein
MSISTQDVARNLISYTVVTDKNSLVKLLERNGIVMPNNPSDKEVTVAVLTASSKSPNFSKELATLLGTKAPKAAEDFSSFVGDSTDFGFTGIDDFSFTGGDDFFNLTAAEKKAGRVTTDNPKGKTGFGLFLQNVGRSLTSQDTINAGVQAGLTAINNRTQNRQNAIQSETVYLTQQQDLLRQQLATKPAKGMSAITWVLVGVGVLALGGIIYFVAKKK